MSHILSFGSQQLELTDPSSRIVAPLAPLAASVRDPESVARNALAEPIGLPPLDQITVDGDQVAIAVGDSSPSMPALVGLIIESLLEGPVAAEDIIVVVPPESPQLVETIRLRLDETLPEPARGKIGVLEHTPADQETLAYLAASKEALPIYLNRHLADADLVIPVGVARPDSTFGYHGIPGGLYPTFADAAAIARFAAPTGADWPSQRKRHWEEASEVSYLAGIMFTVQVIPGLSGGASGIVAGLAEQIGAEVQDSANAAWSIDPPAASDLVIATLEGDSTEQTWASFARALYTARSLATPQGAVVICSEIDQLPGPAIRSLAGFDTIDDLQRHLQRSKSADAAAASMLANTLEHANVFLMSQLEESLVEEIGLAPLHCVDELERLIDRHQSVLLLPSAQHLALRPVSPAEIVMSE